MRSSSPGVLAYAALMEAQLPPVDSLVFDLDGTLWDTCATCALAWNIVVQRHGISFRTIVAEDVRKVVGKMHDECIRETFRGLPEDQLLVLSEDTAVEDNRQIELHGGHVFDGVVEGLTELSRVFPLFIVSNCQKGYIELFLRRTGLSTAFRDFECWGNTGRPKSENLRSLIVRNQLSQPWLIGDTQGDQQAADAWGIPFVHAAYGFGTCEQARLTMAAFADLPRMLAARVDP